MLAKRRHVEGRRGHGASRGSGPLGPRGARDRHDGVAARLGDAPPPSGQHSPRIRSASRPIARTAPLDPSRVTPPAEPPQAEAPAGRAAARAAALAAQAWAAKAEARRAAAFLRQITKPVTQSAEVNRPDRQIRMRPARPKAWPEWSGYIQSVTTSTQVRSPGRRSARMAPVSPLTAPLYQVVPAALALIQASQTPWAGR